MADLYSYRSPDPTWNASAVWPAVERALATLPCGSRVLDVGSGNGLFVGRLAAIGFAAEGCEPSPSGVAVSRAAYPTLVFHEGPAEAAIPYGPYEAVTCIEVIEHVPHTAEFVATLRRLLKPGGRLVLTTPYHGYVKNLAIAVLGRWDAHADPLWEGGHVKFFSKRTLRRALEQGAFEVTGIRGVGRAPYLWTSMVVTATAVE